MSHLAVGPLLVSSVDVREVLGRGRVGCVRFLGSSGSIDKIVCLLYEVVHGNIIISMQGRSQRGEALQPKLSH